MEDVKDAISPTGAWLDDHSHYCDIGLCRAIGDMLPMPSVIVDLGCGDGGYVKRLSARGHYVLGVDGNPVTRNIRNCICADITTPLLNLTAEWVLFLEVGEHIPTNHLETVMFNIRNIAKHGVICSWAERGRRGGYGHVNEMDAHEVCDLFRKHGFLHDYDATTSLQSASNARHIAETVKLLRKIK